jgi:endonuclease III
VTTDQPPDELTRDRGKTLRAPVVLDLLEAELPRAPSSRSTSPRPWELLVATMLSAQSTDVKVNQVTPALFAELPDPEAWRPHRSSGSRS